MSGLLLLCTELTLFCTELPENCIYLNQSELSNFFMFYMFYSFKKNEFQISCPIPIAFIDQLSIF